MNATTVAGAWLGMQLAYDLAAAWKNERKIKVRSQRADAVHVY
jgi:hypothetical protein